MKIMRIYGDGTIQDGDGSLPMIKGAPYVTVDGDSETAKQIRQGWKFSINLQAGTVTVGEKPEHVIHKENKELAKKRLKEKLKSKDISVDDLIDIVTIIL